MGGFDKKTLTPSPSPRGRGLGLSQRGRGKQVFFLPRRRIGIEGVTAR
jgi:hypothetical protein